MKAPSVAIVANQGILEGSYIAAYGLLKSNKQTFIRLHWITDTESEPLIYLLLKELKGLFPNFEYTIHALGEEDLAILPETPFHFSRFAFSKLLLPQILKDEPLVLYLDSDTYPGLNLQELDAYHEKDGNFWACEEYGFGDKNHHYMTLEKKFLCSKGFDANKGYFNTGIYLFKPASLLEEEFIPKATKFLKAYPEKCHFVDQTVYNAVLNNSWQPLDNKWNLRIFLTKTKDPFPWNLNGKITHFYGPDKPWFFQFKPNIGLNQLVNQISATASPELKSHFKPKECIKLKPSFVLRFYAKQLFNKLRGIFG